MIRISIFVDGVIQGQRSWTSVPRVCDSIQYGDGGATKKVAKVTVVFWKSGVEAGDCRVDLFCKSQKENKQ